MTIALPAATARAVDKWLRQGYAVVIRPDEIVVTPPPVPRDDDLDLIDYRKRK